MAIEFFLHAIKFHLPDNIVPGSKVIDISIKDGLRAPRDFVIVGNVVKSLEPAK